MGSDNGLAQKRQQTIIQTNDGQVNTGICIYIVH